MVTEGRPAYVEDQDDSSEEAVRGTRRSATVKEMQRPKVHRDSRDSKGKSRRVGDTGYPPESSKNAQHIELSRERSVKLERRSSTSSSTKSPHKHARPPSAHGNRDYPALSIPHNSGRPESTFYGVPPSPSPRTPGGLQSIPIRPRALTSQTYSGRPASYYPPSASQGPPLSTSAYFQQQYPQQIAPSYPPPSPASSFMRFAATPPPGAAYNVAPQYQITSGQEYFHPQAVSRPLASRFDPIARTQSAFGTRDMSPRISDTAFDPYYDDEYLSQTEIAPPRRKERRNSIRHSFRPDADTLAMPPPQRSSILRRTTNAEYAEPVSQELEYRDRDARTQYRDEPRGPTRRPKNNRHSVSYDLGRESEHVRIEPANTGRRRQSYYETGTSVAEATSDYQDKLNQAANYQSTVLEPSVPLTAEVLKRQQRKVAGSRSSTKSSASRDESDYKKSATTRTTRSGSGADDENLTIKVTGQARVMVGGAQIDCTDGGAIEIKQNQRIRGISGSERSASEYGDRRIEDRQSRVSRPPGRSRMGSQSGSYTRSPQYPEY